MADYSYINSAIRELTEGVEYAVTDLAQASALLYCSMEQINWAGFYLQRDGMLILGPFQGKPACTVIGAGKGVCGTSWKRGETVVVPDVHEFPGHIACSSLSQSEIVVPMFHGDEVYAVLDIDSKELATFDDTDKEWLEKIVELL